MHTTGVWCPACSNNLTNTAVINVTMMTMAGSSSHDQIAVEAAVEYALENRDRLAAFVKATADASRANRTSSGGSKLLTPEEQQAAQHAAEFKDGLLQATISSLAAAFEIQSAAAAAVPEPEPQSEVGAASESAGKSAALATNVAAGVNEAETKPPTARSPPYAVATLQPSLLKQVPTKRAQANNWAEPLPRPNPKNPKIPTTELPMLWVSRAPWGRGRGGAALPPPLANSHGAALAESEEEMLTELGGADARILSQNDAGEVSLASRSVEREGGRGTDLLSRFRGSVRCSLLQPMGCAE